MSHSKDKLWAAVDPVSLMASHTPRGADRATVFYWRDASGRTDTTPGPNSSAGSRPTTAMSSLGGAATLSLCRLMSAGAAVRKRRGRSPRAPSSLRKRYRPDARSWRSLGRAQSRWPANSWREVRGPGRCRRVREISAQPRRGLRVRGHLPHAASGQPSRSAREPVAPSRDVLRGYSLAQASVRP